jgi:hypothetical protein
LVAAPVVDKRRTTQYVRTLTTKGVPQSPPRDFQVSCPVLVVVLVVVVVLVLVVPRGSVHWEASLLPLP